MVSQGKSQQSQHFLKGQYVRIFVENDLKCIKIKNRIRKILVLTMSVYSVAEIISLRMPAQLPRLQDTEEESYLCPPPPTLDNTEGDKK